MSPVPKIVRPHAFLPIPFSPPPHAQRTTRARVADIFRGFAEPVKKILFCHTARGTTCGWSFVTKEFARAHSSTLTSGACHVHVRGCTCLQLLCSFWSPRTRAYCAATRSQGPNCFFRKLRWKMFGVVSFSKLKSKIKSTGAITVTIAIYWDRLEQGWTRLTKYNLASRARKTVRNTCMNGAEKTKRRLSTTQRKAMPRS
jgi:hypothetical protein